MHDPTPDQIDARLRAAPSPPVPPEVERRLAARIAEARNLNESATRQVARRNVLAPQRKEHHPMASKIPSRRATPGIAITSGIALLVVVLALVIFHNAPHGTGVANVTTPPTGTARQAAYLGADGHLHFVTAQGKDTIGPIPPSVPGKPSLSSAGNLLQPSPTPLTGTSADGRYLAYIGTLIVTTPALPTKQGTFESEVQIYDMHTKTFASVLFPTAEPSTLLFAPSGSLFVVNDSPQIIYPDGAPGIIVVDAATHTQKTISLNGKFFEDHLLGWSDATHVIALMEPGNPNAKSYGVMLSPDSGGPSALPLVSVDVTTGATRTIATVTNTPPDLFLSPDGTKIFSAPNVWDTNALVIDVATGAIQELPNISQTFADALQPFDNPGFAQGGNWAVHFTGMPGSHTLALSLSAASLLPEGGTQPITQDAGVWLINLDSDQATRLDHAQYPLTWMPDGTTLFVCDAPTQTIDNSGYAIGTTLGALSPVSSTGTLRTVATNVQAYFGLVQAQ